MHADELSLVCNLGFFFPFNFNFSLGKSVILLSSVFMTRS